MAYIRSAASAFQYRNYHPNCCHSLRQVTLTESTVILTTWLKHFAFLVCEQWHKDLSFWWHWYVHWNKYLLLRDELKILSKLQAFALCGAFCMKCFEKCTYFANIKDDLRNAWKRLRKTVIHFKIIFFPRVKSKLNCQQSWLQFSVSHDPSEIILICWFAAEDFYLFYQ